jgi:sodium transport system ATP-binding protein
MQEIAALADQIVIIANGELAAAGSPAALREQFGEDDLEQVFVDAVSISRAPGASLQARGLSS